MIKQFFKQFNLVAVLLFLNSIKTIVSSDPFEKYLGQVIFSNVFFRHGDRMPIEFYPNDPNKDGDWPFSTGQLTEIGKRQEYELGRWLRQRYSHLLSETYKSEEIYVESTDVDRTLMSAQCNLAGLYEPTKTQEWNPNIHWQPIPIHTVPLKDDVHLGAGSTAICPLYDLELSRVENSPEIKKINNRFKEVYEYVTAHTGADVYDLKSGVKIYDTLFIEERYNFSLPSWTKSVYPYPLKEVSAYSFAINTWTHQLKRLKIGPLLKEVVKHFEEKRDGTLTPNRNIWMYSAHDMTLASILNTLGAFDIHQPPYASSLMLELRFKNQEYIVTMFYRNSTTRAPYLLPILGCDTLCPLDQFISLTEPFIPSDWQEECNTVSSTIPSNSIMIIIIVCLSSLIFLFVSLITFWIRRNPQSWYHNMRPPLYTAKCKEVVIGS